MQVDVRLGVGEMAVSAEASLALSAGAPGPYSTRKKGRLPQGRRPLAGVTPDQRNIALTAPKLSLSVATAQSLMKSNV